jgi:hypothetical protein
MKAFTKVTSIVLAFPMLAIAQAASDIKPAVVFGVTDVASSVPALSVVTVPQPVVLRVFVESDDEPAARKPDRDPSLETAKNFDAECPDVKLLINAGGGVYEVPLSQVKSGFSNRDNQSEAYDVDEDHRKGKEGSSVRNELRTKGVCAQNAAALRDLGRIGALTTEEQARVDKAGDDSRPLQQVLLDVDQERIDYWRAKLNAELYSLFEWERLKRASSYAIYKNDTLPSQYGEAGLKLSQKVDSDEEDLSNFVAARTALQLWKPMSFEAYKTGQSSTQGIVANSAVEQQKIQ